MSAQALNLDAAANAASFEEFNPETPAQDAAGQGQPSGDGSPEQAAAAGEGKPQEKPKVAAEVPQVTDQDAVAIAEHLASFGYTKDNIDSLLSEGQAFKQFSYLVDNNPDELLRSIERWNPEAYQRLIDKASDHYLERHYSPEESDEGKAGAPQSRGAVAVTPELRELDRRLAQIESVLVQSHQAAAAQQVRTAYEAKVNELVGKLGLSAKDQKAVRAMLNDSIANDPGARMRVNQGILVDVPRHLQKVLADWTADTVGHAEAEKQRRAEVEGRAVKHETAAGAVAQGTQVPKPEDSWEAAEQAFAQALLKSRKK